MERFHNVRQFSGDTAIPTTIAGADDPYPDNNVMIKLDGEELGEHGLVLGPDDVPVFEGAEIQLFSKLYVHEFYAALDPWELNSIQWAFVKTFMPYDDHPFVTNGDYDDPRLATLKRFENLIGDRADERTLVLDDHSTDGGFFTVRAR